MKRPGMKLLQRAGRNPGKGAKAVVKSGGNKAHPWEEIQIARAKRRKSKEG